MDSDAQARVMEQVFSGSAALAGLILVFLGGIYTSFDSYDATQQRAVRDRYVCRCWVTFGGFVAALTSASLALSFSWAQNDCVFWASIIALAISAAALFWIGVRSNLDIG